MKKTMMTLALIAGLGSPVVADDMLPMMETATVANLTLADGFAHATLPNQPVAGGFLTITNAGADQDRLIAAASPIAGVMQIHTMMMDDDVMVMRELPDGLMIPAGEVVTLEPGGLHLMFMQLNAPLTLGAEVDVTLTFEDAGDVTVTLPIRKKMAAGMTHGGDS